MAKDRAYIVPHTHWDREWRYPIWKNRVLLLDFMDKLLGELEENPDYKQFLMDGQSVIIEDYLEVRPEKREMVCKFIKEGRIAIGPWYTLPDQYPVDGECLVRNLLTGHRISKKYGGCLNIGYTSFGWGQTSQLPQIYAGFGIDLIVTAKNVSKKRAPKSEFWWEAPDGTRILSTRLGNMARHGFFMNAVLPYKYGVDYFSGEYKFNWSKGGAVYRMANEDCNEDFFNIEVQDTANPGILKSALQTAWDATDDTMVGTYRLLLAGCDFTGPIPELAEMIKKANTEFEDKEFVYGTIQEYAEKLKQHVEKDKLVVVKGELRDGPANDCTANALATRIYIKQLNRKAQNMLLHKAEPMSAVLSMIGAEYPSVLIEKAWNYLLKSQAHDSINGVTQDRTAEDILYGLNQAYEIGRVVYEKNMEELVKLIDMSGYSDENVLLVVVNPLPYASRDILAISVDLPREYNIWDFEMEDPSGNMIDVQPVSRLENTIPVHDLHARPWPFFTDRHVVYMDTGEIPACGYKVFKVLPNRKFDRSVLFGPINMRTSTGGEISRAHNTLENEYLKVVVNSNGTFNVEDKSTGKQYDCLHYFEDTGDVGDYWVYLPPYHNKTFTSHGCNSEIWCEDNGNLSATLGVRIKMTIPAYGMRPENGINKESGRSKESAEMEIITYLTLKKGSRRLDIRVLIENNTEDHRVRVMYPTGINAEYADSAGHFTVDRRPVYPQNNGCEVYYPEMQTLPQQAFVDVSDGKNGFAIVNRNLTEYEAENGGGTTVALTLFRSVRNIICTEMRLMRQYPEQDGGQCLGRREFEYSIFPHEGGWAEGNVYREAESLNIGMSAIQASVHKMGRLPLEEGLFYIKPSSVILSAFKKAEDRNSYILRVYNPAGKSVESTITLAAKIKEAYLTDLKEERIGSLAVDEERIVSFSVGSGKIVTIELLPK